MEANSLKETNAKSSERDYALLDLIQDPAFVVDTNKKVLYANDALTDLISRKRGQAVGTPIHSLIQTEESGVDDALATGIRKHILTWATIREKKYFLELQPTPILDEKGSIIGVLQTIKDRTSQKLTLQAVQDLIAKVKVGELSARADIKADGDYKVLVEDINEMLDTMAEPIGDLKDMIARMSVLNLTQNISKEYVGVWDELKNGINFIQTMMLLVVEQVTNISNGDLNALEQFLKKFGRLSDKDALFPAFTRLLETLKGVIGEIEILTGAVTAGDLTKRGNENEYQGSYRGIIHGMNGLVESVANPLDELIAVLNRLAVNDLTQKIEKDYTGAWDELKKAANTTLGRVLHIQQTTVNISHGDLSELDAYRKIGRRSEHDQLVPGFTRMMEAIESVTGDVQLLVESAVEGKLRTRADATKHQGEYHKVIEGINATLDAILQPIKEASDCLQEMAKGNLDAEMKGDYKGDHAAIKDNLHSTLIALNDILSQVSMAVDQVATGSRQVSDSSQSLSQAATESASALEQISASVHEITSQTTMNAENATQANQLAARAKASAEKGDASMGEMVRAMNEINESAANVSKIIKTIDEIAFQTNLLALNAAVEAARAGSHGKGFAVVAEEVRNLAQRSANAAKETTEMIEGSIKKTEAGAKVAAETSSALEEIVTGVTKVTDLVGEIAAASKEQSEGISQVNTGLSQVDQMTQQVTANAEESASASEELSGQALQLKEMLSKFKLRKRAMNLDAAGILNSITPEMLQMLKSMLQSQKLPAASAPAKPAIGRQPGKSATGARGTKPSSVIALDDSEFGNF